MFNKIIENVRKEKPLIHNITNYVTVNDCANITLACGASPIMADDENEVEEITSICGGLNINIGTLNSRTITSMLKAGKVANKLNHPINLDPVGVGASTLRTQTANQLIENIQFSVIRGNMSEIKTLATGSGATRGVDASVEDKVTKDNLLQCVNFAKSFAKSVNAVIAITGEIDIVTDGEKAFCIYNGHPMMSSITGTGCQLSSLITAYITANKEDIFNATAAAVCAMGICGELAFKRLENRDGNASYRNYIIDEIYNLTPEELSALSKYEIL